MLRVRSPGCSADVGGRDSDPGNGLFGAPTCGIEKSSPYLGVLAVGQREIAGIRAQLSPLVLTTSDPLGQTPARPDLPYMLSKNCRGPYADVGGVDVSPRNPVFCPFPRLIKKNSPTYRKSMTM
jgi:hypothetical protein